MNRVFVHTVTATAIVTLFLSGWAGLWQANAAHVAMVQAKMIGGGSSKLDRQVRASCETRRLACRNGAAYFLERQPAEAVHLAERAVARSSADSLAHYRLGEALWAAGRKQEAQRVWRDSHVIVPKLSGLLLDAWSAASQGNMTKAESLAIKAIELDPEFADGYDVLASLRWGRDWPGTVKALEQAIRFAEPRSAPYYWNTGRLFLINGDWTNAVDSLEKSEQLEPSPWTRQYLEDARRRMRGAASPTSSNSIGDDITH